MELRKRVPFFSYKIKVKIFSPFLNDSTYFSLFLCRSAVLIWALSLSVFQQSLILHEFRARVSLHEKGGGKKNLKNKECVQQDSFPSIFKIHQPTLNFAKKEERKAKQTKSFPSSSGILFPRGISLLLLLAATTSTSTPRSLPLPWLQYVFPAAVTSLREREKEKNG